ncbi:zinc finger protein 286A-like [Spodoptera litura]|uniref:Zinc finger protein 286A-like n=1 Tax=Spodoptera litura TaxID=69820 RepID=A0A9J7ISI6_SPOLT|nr:zinc finger protein 286A-like [Spodoptera litura]
MLHNTGPYGPNETPVNMGAPVNMTPMSGHMNLAHNINNLSKMSHHAGQGPSGHFNLPEYAHYNQSTLGMPPQMGQFPNYQQLGFQHSYMNQSAPSVNDLPFPNGMFPMNFNIQNEHSANMMNYAYEKRASETMRQESYKEHNMRKMPLNIPQIPNKSYARHSIPDDDYGLHNTYHDVHHNLDLSLKTQEKIQLDSTRKKNIENTVRLIENILINSSNKPKEVPSPPSRPTSTRMELLQQTVIEKAPKSNKPATETHSHTALQTQADPLQVTPADFSKSKPNEPIEVPIEVNDDSQDKEMSENEPQSDEEDIKPIAITQHFITDDAEVNTDNSIVIKVEKDSWADSECFTPFLKDVNGFQKDDNMNYRIIEAETSVAEAIAVYKNGIKHEGVFECPHCALLFKHPKRFIIHHNWHTFGLTNIRRIEIAKVKEQRRFERKEARVIERMNSKEVTEETSVDGKVFPCKDCDKVFSAKGSLKNHRQRTHPTRIRECRICHKPISSWMALRAHMVTHSADSGLGFQCAECPKRFKYSHSLAKHSDTHLEKTHACTECPKKFGSQALLKMHMKTHERVLRGATFRCTYCGKGFFESYSLQVHERTHRNERPFTCDICNTSFGTNSSLKRHVKVSHNTSKPYQCSVCHRNFITESIRDRHEQRLHGNPEDFKFPCKLCSSKYLKMKDLQKHVYKMHPKSKRKKKDDKESDSE